MSDHYWHYVYYSYEQCGRGYIGKRSSKVPPNEDPYLGSFTDKTFKPTHKIIIATFEKLEDAMCAEIALHRLFKVDRESHFANKVIHSSPRFCRIPGQRNQIGTIRKKNKDKRDYSLSAQIVELEKQFGPGDYADLELQLQLIEKENRALIESGRGDEIIAVNLLENPGGLVLPIADLSSYCRQCKLDEDKINLVLDGKLDNWNGWRRPIV